MGMHAYLLGLLLAGINKLALLLDSTGRLIIFVATYVFNMATCVFLYC